MDYESGQMTDRQVVEFFGQLIKEGLAWQLQGSYGRQAAAFIEAGLISKDGEVNWERFERMEDED
jgi:hypothetical protein